MLIIPQKMEKKNPQIGQINKLNKVARFKIAIQKSIDFNMLAMNIMKLLGENSIYNNIKNNKILRYKFNRRNLKFIF